MALPIPRSWLLYVDWFVRYVVLSGAMVAVWYLPWKATAALLATVTVLNNILVPRDAKLFPPDFNGDSSLLPAELEHSVFEGSYKTRDGVVLKYRRSGSGPKMIILGTRNKSPERAGPYPRAFIILRRRQRSRMPRRVLDSGYTILSPTSAQPSDQF